MLRDKIQSINRQIENLQAQITAENAPKREECIRSLNMFDEALKRADLDEIRSIIAILIDRIELDNSDVTIFWNF